MNGYEDAVLSNAGPIKINKNIEGWIRYSAGVLIAIGLTSERLPLSNVDYDADGVDESQGWLDDSVVKLGGVLKRAL